MPDEAAKTGPTPQEAIFFFNIVQNIKNKLDIDWDAVADSSGFKNAGVAKVRFGQIKRKYGLDSDSPGKKNTKAQATGDLPPTPTKIAKTPKARGGRRGRVVKKEESDEDNREETPTGAPVVVKGEPFSAKDESERPADGFSYF